MIKRKKTSPEYSRYLHGPIWKNKRAAVLKRAGGKCEKCGAGDLLQVHHLRYSYKYRDEPLSDLQALCKSCHYAVHKRKPRAYRLLKRMVIYPDGNFVAMENYRPFFAELKRTVKGLRIKTPRRFGEWLE